MEEPRETVANGGKKMASKKKRSLVARILGWLGAVIAVAVVTVVVWFIISMQPVSSDETTKQFIVEPGDTLEIVGLNLQREGLVKNSFVFTLVAKLTSKQVMAGAHYLSPSKNVIEIAYELSKPAGAEQKIVRILAGQTLVQIKASLEVAGFMTNDINNAFDKTYSSPILADKPESATLEGYIFPDTYHLSADDDASVLIQLAIDTLYDKMTSDGSLSAIKSRGKTVYETLTFASIIQKEIASPTEQPKVAGVFQNRLNIGMSLGSDVTYFYAVARGFCNGIDDIITCTSPYNTRNLSNIGLTPGPIANMEYSAIQAAIRPEDNDFLFFVAGDDGTTYYAVTEAEHNANVANYCHELCQ